MFIVTLIHQFIINIQCVLKQFELNKRIVSNHGMKWVNDKSHLQHKLRKD